MTSPAKQSCVHQERTLSAPGVTGVVHSPEEPGRAPLHTQMQEQVPQPTRLTLVPHISVLAVPTCSHTYTHVHTHTPALRSPSASLFTYSQTSFALSRWVGTRQASLPGTGATEQASTAAGLGVVTLEDREQRQVL